MCSVAEANANNTVAMATGELTENQIAFRKRFAEALIENKLTRSGGVRSSPISARKRSRLFFEVEHRHMTKSNYTGVWNPTKKQFTPVTTPYLKERCRSCKDYIRNSYLLLI